MPLNMSKNICQSCVNEETQTFTPTTIVVPCDPCEVSTSTELVDELPNLCPCPEDDPPSITVTPEVWVETLQECSPDLVVNMVKDKFCNIGPKCT